jgi:hypothetical protein
MNASRIMGKPMATSEYKKSFFYTEDGGRRLLYNSDTILKIKLHQILEESNLSMQCSTKANPILKHLLHMRTENINVTSHQHHNYTDLATQ